MHEYFKKYLHIWISRLNFFKLKNIFCPFYSTTQIFNFTCMKLDTNCHSKFTHHKLKKSPDFLKANQAQDGLLLKLSLCLNC